MPETHGTDDTLLERLNRGDPAALEQVFRVHYTPLCRYALRFSAGRRDAEDVVSDVFASLWEGRHHLAVTTSIKAYLYAAVRNRALRETRTTERRRFRLEEAGVPPAMGETPPDPERQAERDALRERVDAAIAALPERAREALTLRRYHGLSYGEIADIMQVSKKTVENHLLRARDALRDLLSDLRYP